MDRHGRIKKKEGPGLCLVHHLVGHSFSAKAEAMAKESPSSSIRPLFLAAPTCRAIALAKAEARRT